ncbi:HNH endonuclease signature motif containing protein [Corynebacterium kalidii]|uniref:HNH endonuclease n=1 Tax=Corynebacterium kalidii TaxID=2931982 RepID=A0A9X1WHL8_9CORY|nr:HNH endonuclease signature motif containing protein [Corynebacterium kalidii]MCJ7858618.1 HNH endonuclease [Corynebacterium kalidii]
MVQGGVDLGFIERDFEELYFDCDVEYVEENLDEPCWAVSAQEVMYSAKRQVNVLELDIAREATPSPTDEVSRHARKLSVGLGVSKGKALAYCDIGTMLSRMPALALALQGGAFSFDHLRALADSVVAVDDAHVAEVESGVVSLVTPTTPRQVVPGVVTLRRLVQQVVAEVQPSARPIDPEGQGEPPPPEAQLDFSVDTRADAATTFRVTVPTDEGIGMIRIIDAVAAARGCSRSRALVDLVHGRAGDVSVTLNCYRNLDDGRMHLESTWLHEVATERWMARVTELCVAGHSEVSGYTPSAHQRATDAGRDGTCRFPGCDSPAATAQLDHVTRWDGEDDGGGKTATWSMHSLCPGCHSLKTRGLYDVTLNPDGSDWWTSVEDGHVYVSTPTGPLADAVLDFDTRLHRKVRTLARHNEARMRWIAEIEAAAEEAQKLVPF